MKVDVLLYSSTKNVRVAISGDRINCRLTYYESPYFRDSTRKKTAVVETIMSGLGVSLGEPNWSTIYNAILASLPKRIHKQFELDENKITALIELLRC